jgi:hypothetical protein
MVANWRIGELVVAEFAQCLLLDVALVLVNDRDAGDGGYLELYHLHLCLRRVLRPRLRRICSSLVVLPIPFRVSLFPLFLFVSLWNYPIWTACTYTTPPLVRYTILHSDGDVDGLATRDTYEESPTSKSMTQSGGHSAAPPMALNSWRGVRREDEASSLAVPHPKRS